MISNSPARISWSASAIASSPDRQTLFTVIPGVVIGMPAADRGLARRDLPGAGLQHLTHDDVLDLLGPHAAALEGGRDGVPAQRRGRDILEVARAGGPSGFGRR
jgi:hypothetical protein